MISKLKIICGFIPIAACVAFLCIYLTSGRELTADSIIDFIKTDNLILAAFLLLCMFALKSISVCFPIVLLYIAGGLIFPPAVAVSVNTIGTAICLTLPYLIGRAAGSELISKIMRKYPKVSRFVSQQKSNEFFVSFLLRAIRIFPTDAVSLYLGSVKFAYLTYLVAGLLGEMPGLICETLIGVSIENPESPMFIISIALTAAVTVFSCLWYIIHLHKNSKANTP